jgi:hypothetical protein
VAGMHLLRRKTAPAPQGEREPTRLASLGQPLILDKYQLPLPFERYERCRALFSLQGVTGEIGMPSILEIRPASERSAISVRPSD